MTARLFCHHGHELKIGERTGAARSFVCPRCGSITKMRPAAKLKPSGSVDPTVDSATSESEQRADSDATEAHPDALRFLSLDRNDAAVDQSSSQHDPNEHFEPPRPAGYQVLEEIGRGGMGVVYRARNEALRREVALKTLQSMSPAGLHQFKQEFRTLADIAHPNLASLYELLSDGHTWCFTMEILEGVDFLEYVWSGMESLESGADQPTTVSGRSSRVSAQRLERLDDALKQLAIGLDALHEAGVLHRDIKPSNVMMAKDGRLVLLDFGLAAEIRKHGGREQRIVQGTPVYMSPEQAAGKMLSQASDWYSVGVILYEVLTGRFPITGNASQILSRKQTQTPLRPDRLALEIPKRLNELCIALLDRDPQRRPTASDVLRCVGASALADEVATQHQAAAIRSVELVGRERHFEVLNNALARVSKGDTLSFFVHGKSGMGKSVLVHSFLDSVQQQGTAVVLKGRCYEQESVPFKALDSLIDSLSVYLETLPGNAAQVVMPRDRLALTRVFPVLGRVPESPNAAYPSIDNVDQQELRQRAMNALRELLQRLAIREPLVLYVDDLQWGDVDSAGLLADLVRPPDAPRMLLLGSYRSEDVESSLCLRALTEAYSKGQHLPHREELAVESLTQVESTQLALKLLGRDDDASQVFATKVAEESGGWPFFVWELVQHVQEDSEIADQTLELDEVIWTRLNRLPGDARRLLELIAVAGRPLPALETYQALDAVSKGPQWLAQLRAANFVRTTESKDATVVETYHDRIRESVYNHLDASQVKGHHLNLALMIERVSGVRVDDLQAHINSTADYEEPNRPHELDKHDWQRVFDLAYFFDAAGHPERAFPYALVAAEQTWSQNALEAAEQQYRIAARGAAGVAERLQFRVAEGLGDVLMTRGKYDQALAQYEAAASLTTADMAQARIDGKLGTLFFRKGDMAKAGTYLETALQKLGDPPPRNVLVRTASLAKEGGIQLLHTYWPSQFLSRRPSDTTQYFKDMLRVRLHDRLARVYWYTQGMVPTLWSHLRQINLAERYPPSQELGRTYSFHAITMTGIPNGKRGIAYAEKSYQISSDLGDLWGQGQARSYQTFSYIVLARLREAVETGREAVRLLEQAGDVWEANMARMIGTMAVYHLGDLQLALQESKRAYEIGCETGDHSAMAIAMWLWVRIHPESVPTERIKTEFERARADPLTAAMAIQARGLELLLCEDQPREGAKVLQQCLDLAAESSIRNVCVFSGVTWKATALRIAAEREPQGVPRKRALVEAKKAVRDSLKITKSYLNDRPHALRECALVAVLEGHEEQARRYFDDSLRVAEEHEARYEYAKTLLARAEAGLNFGWSQAEQQLIEGRAKMDDAERRLDPGE